MKLLLIPVFLLVFANSVYAEITNPYTVDEKPQVLFGDSVAVDDYHGLENYSYEYLNGYLNISFTYTHSICCFASYPPLLYITNVDPRSTSTPVVKSSANIYRLLPYSHNQEHTTHWYFYDIQFDSSGYNVSVKRGDEFEVFNGYVEIENLLDSDWVSLANRYPILLPEFEHRHSMSFTPLPLVDFAPPPGLENTDPVIIIPGIMGTELYNGDELIWPNLINMFESNDYFLTENLNLDLVGNSIINISIGGVIKKILNIPVFSVDIFDSLVTDLESSNYLENQNYFLFPYDWRLDLDKTKDLLK